MLFPSREMQKLTFSGLESSGKSLMLAKMAREVVYKNRRWQRRRKGVSRPIVSNMKFSSAFENWATHTMGVQIVYWETLEELIKFEECDVFIDEIGNFLDSRMWATLSLDVRAWFSQGAKRGISIYSGAQDFTQIDKAYRRLATDLIHVWKLVGSPRPSKTSPNVKLIWGLCFRMSLNPRKYEEEKDKFNRGSLFSMRLFWIKKKDCLIFDTNAKLPVVRSVLKRHFDVLCPTCGVLKPIHV